MVTDKAKNQGLLNGIELLYIELTDELNENVKMVMKVCK